MVAGDINDFGALPTFAKEFLNHVVVILGPVNAAPERPYIDQVSDKVEFLKFCVSKELEQRSGLAAPRS
jgi:hypothetical protein